MSAKSKRRKSAPAGNPRLAAFCAWLLPGGGHLVLGRRRRALAFFVVIALALGLGLYLHGNMPWVWRGSPLRTLATLACLGNGPVYVLLRFGFGVEGDVQAPGYDYGSAFVLTAGLMNLLLVLDAWDIARGSKE